MAVQQHEQHASGGGRPDSRAGHTHQLADRDMHFGATKMAGGGRSRWGRRVGYMVGDLVWVGHQARCSHQPNLGFRVGV